MKLFNNETKVNKTFKSRGGGAGGFSFINKPIFICNAAHSESVCCNLSVDLVIQLDLSDVTRVQDCVGRCLDDTSITQLIT